MRPSSPSTSHSTQVPIKVQHRIAKQKVVRRKRVDLECGCSYFIHINCSNHGFTHRGTHHCASSLEWRFYLGDTKSPVFQDNQPRRETVQLPTRHNNSTNQVQPQPAEGVGDSQVFSELQSLDELTPSDWSFLKGI
ncbi:transcritional activation protein [Ageratum leaf curl Cameroon virus]|uniref:Transcriptional activator protein n=3 Tax=Begomovirus TaxID=10814 RepID=F8LG81_9GEMI|nr:transcritional activation protein [Ageratum leaf curl Cameroon virus]CBX51440.1 transcritional activation protein [Ageratum leaf curl Cameroon virus]CCC14811.1 transcriptional activation protein [Ageratum leaf curl Cameroon virus [CM:AGFG24:2009]]CCC14817.1 transcriptional activation protein [Ageratum leaf curl Cameroon virus [CM:AGFG14:2009]]